MRDWYKILLGMFLIITSGLIVISIENQDFPIGLILIYVNIYPIAVLSSFWQTLLLLSLLTFGIYLIFSSNFIEKYRFLILIIWLFLYFTNIVYRILVNKQVVLKGLRFANLTDSIHLFLLLGLVGILVPILTMVDKRMDIYLTTIGLVVPNIFNLVLILGPEYPIMDSLLQKIKSSVTSVSIIFLFVGTPILLLNTIKNLRQELIYQKNQTINKEM